MGNVIVMNPCDPSVDKILWLDHSKLTKPQDCGKCNLYLRIYQWSYFDDEYNVHFFVKWLSVEPALGQACSRSQDSGESGLKKIAHKPGTSSGEPGCFLSPSCTQSSLSSDCGRPVLEFHLFRSLGNQLSSHSLRGNTSFGSTLVFFSLDVSVKEQK